LRRIFWEWRRPLRQLQRAAKVVPLEEYEQLTREFGLLTGQCLEAREKLLGAQDSFARELSISATLRTRLAQLERQHKDDVPGLTPGEIERLAVLSEECGEVVRAIGKIMRYGWESSSPFVAGGRSNRMALERELGSMRAVVNLMLDNQDVRLNAVQSWQRTKKTALENWTLYQPCSLPRDEQLAMMRNIRSSAENATGS
jgi:NTP pyrophosphatase (non-canonical NTP hydrolase)